MSEFERDAVTKPKKQPAVPPAYRPQPAARVLQTKSAAGQPSPFKNNPGRPPIAPRLHPSRQAAGATQPGGAGVRAAGGARAVNNASTVPAAYRPQPAPKVSPPKSPPRQPMTNNVVVPQAHAFAARPVLRQATVQRFTSRIVQAVKIYPNLHPGAVEPVDPSSVFRLHSFANQYRLHKVNSHGVNVPNQQYNFVRTREGEMLLHSRYRHPTIAEGKQVLYAGEIFFNNGQLQWWSNGSGHYQPDVEDAEQANLPMDYFFSYQQVIKGEHTRKKG
jgi:hypothetical protein